MEIRATPRLEVLSRLPAQPSRHPPLLFVHGAFGGAWVWDEYFLQFFAEHGYAAYAVSLRGHGESEGEEHIDWWSISDYVDDVCATIAELKVAPILIGHSMGGFVVQKTLARARVPGAVLMSSVPPQGLLSSTFSLAFAQPDLLTQINRVLSGTWVETTVLRDALFAQDIEESRLVRYYQKMHKESQRALWDMTLFDLLRPLDSDRQPPLLVLGSEYDRLIPPDQARATAAYYGVEAEVFPGLGHGMMLEQDWQVVAERLLAWLTTLKA